MTQIFETKHFILNSRDKPQITRTDGGHICIDPKIPREVLSDFSKDELEEMILLQTMAGIAMMNGMKKSGIEIRRINYQINSNFNLAFHLHLYGRAVSAKIQPFGQVIQAGPTKEEFLKQIEGLEALNYEDIRNIQDEIKKLLQTDRFGMLRNEIS